jgi:predicted CXXCH cytochrome family protein
LTDNSNQVSYEQLPEEEERRNFLYGCFFALLFSLIILAIIYLLFAKKVVEIRQISESRPCLRCHGELLPNFKKRKVHLPFSLKRCTACHTKHGFEELNLVKKIEKEIKKSVKEKAGKKSAISQRVVRITRFRLPKPRQKSKLKYPMRRLCGQCHKGTMAESRFQYSMPPFEKAQCLSCHQPHASNYDDLTKAPIGVICLSCHPKVAKYYSKANLHPPFKAGNCTSCHKPHASNFKPLLRRHPKVLCFACHPSVARLKRKRVQMQPFTQGKCPMCHNPHGSNQKRLLQKPLPDLCFGCHKAIGKLEKKAVKMPPFKNGKCLECHYPHGGDYNKLLRAALQGNKICFRCHANLEANYLPIGHNRIVRNASPYQPEAGVGSCLNCHEPHASNYAGLIQKEQISLCLSCHGPRRYFAHPMGFVYDDPWRGGYLRCGSCHNPMGSGIVRLKRRDRDGLCLSCHLSSDPSYIYYSSGSKKWHRYQIFDSL